MRVWFYVSSMRCGSQQKKLLVASALVFSIYEILNVEPKTHFVSKNSKKNIGLLKTLLMQKMKADALYAQISYGS